MKKTFYDLVNGYRVEEANRLLLDSKNKNFTILSVGFEAGFNSKTTFNTVFKKFTGLTPTEYRDKHKKELAPFEGLKFYLTFLLIILLNSGGSDFEYRTNN